MSVHTFIVQLYTTYDQGGPGLEANLAETIKAGMYKTYANPAREDDGITVVSVVPAVAHGTSPTTWSAKRLA